MNIKVTILIIIAFLFCINLAYAEAAAKPNSGKDLNGININAFNHKTWEGIPASRSFPKLLTSYEAGTVDSSFGINGSVRIAMDSTGIFYTTYGNAMAVQQDGKILIAGSNQNSLSNDAFVVVRLNPDGTVDKTFGKNGWAETFISGGTKTDIADAIAIAPDGRIVLAGFSIINSSQADKFAVARFNADGSIDSTFGNFGSISFNIPTGDSLSDYARSVAVQSDGRIILAGSSKEYVYTKYGLNSGTTTSMVVVRLNPDGTFDGTFGIGGETRIHYGNDSLYSDARSVLLLSNGKILVAGNTKQPIDLDNWSYFNVTKLDSDGTIDTTFGTNGTSVVLMSSDSSKIINCHAAALQQDGKIVLAGTEDDLQFVLTRINADGSPDTTFGNSAIEEVQVIPQYSFADFIGTCVALQTDGKIVEGGYAYGLNDFAIARLNSNGTMDTTFGSSGWTLAGIEGTNQSDNEMYAITITQDGKILTAGYSEDSQNNYAFCAARFLSSSATTAVARTKYSPVKFRLSQNYPNPFNPSTTINFSIAKSGLVSLKVYNILGELVRTLVNKFENGGEHKIVFDADNYGLASGVYFYRLKENNFIKTDKMVYLK